jgi:hypothetical protein
MTGLAGCRYQRLPFQYLERWPVGYLTVAVRQCVTRTIVLYYHRLARLKPSRYNLVQPKQPYDYTRILSPICRDLMPSNLGSAPSTRYYPRRSMKAGYWYADVSTGIADSRSCKSLLSRAASSITVHHLATNSTSTIRYRR